MKQLVYLVLTVALTLVVNVVVACDVCQKQQPKILRGVAHGAGPQSDWDYVIVGVTAVIALVSLVYALRWMIKPGEKSRDHIKHSILN